MDKSETLNKRQGNSNSRSTGNSNPVDRTNFRSLICDESGIIIGEMVYRCLICSFISVSMDKIRAHYQTEHVDIEDISNGEFRYVNDDYCPSPSGDSLNDNQQKATSTTTSKENQSTNDSMK